MITIAVANAVATKLNAAVKAASAAKVATMPKKLKLRVSFLSFRYSHFKAHVGLPAWAFLYPVKLFIRLEIWIKNLSRYLSLRNFGPRSIYYLLTLQGSKILSLPRPTDDSKSAPLAIESFAIDPEVYHQRMEMVEALVKKQTDQGK